MYSVSPALLSAEKDTAQYDECTGRQQRGEEGDCVGGTGERRAETYEVDPACTSVTDDHSVYPASRTVTVYEPGATLSEVTGGVMPDFALLTYTSAPVGEEVTESEPYPSPEGG